MQCHEGGGGVRRLIANVLSVFPICFIPSLIYHDIHQNTIDDKCLANVIVKKAVPVVKIALLKMTRFRRKKFLQSIHLLEKEGGGLA